MEDTEVTIVDPASPLVPIAEEEVAVLSAEELVFSRLVAKGYSYTTAYRKSFPADSKLKYDTIRRKASELATKSSIQTEVQTTKQRTAHLVRIAEDRLEDILVNDSSTAKGNKVADVAMFMYDHANGKAIQKIESRSAHVSVVYDLSGTGEEVPLEIQEQLKKLQK